MTAGNGIDSNGGGMLENMGATIAINDMLMQSHAGAIRFFPVSETPAITPLLYFSHWSGDAFIVLSRSHILAPPALS